MNNPTVKRTIPVPSMEQLQSIWSKLSSNDKLNLLGHENVQLSVKDSAKLMKILANLAKAK